MPLQRLTLAIVLLAAALVGFGAIGRALPLWLLVPVLVVPPLLLVPHWRRLHEAHGWSWFLWVKLASLLPYGLLLRAGGDGLVPLSLLGPLVVVVLVVNILEAVVKDAQLGRRANAFAGLMVAASTPWAVTAADGATRLHAPAAWLCAYTVWNFAFVLQDRRVWGHHVAVLGAPLLLAAGDPATWLQHRVFTLYAFLVAYMTFFPWFVGRLSTGPVRLPGGERAVVALGLAIAAWALVEAIFG